MKVRPVETEVFRAGGRDGGPADGRTDRYHDANNRFSQFCERA
jgi:hypothetical protein